MINIEVASKHYGYGLKFYTPKGGKDYLYINDGALKISYTLTNNKILILNKEKTISIPESEFMVILDKYKASIPVELYPKLIEIYQTSDTKRLTPKVEFNEDESIKHIQGKIGYGLKNEFYYITEANKVNLWLKTQIEFNSQNLELFINTTTSFFKDGPEYLHYSWKHLEGQLSILDSQL